MRLIVDQVIKWSDEEQQRWPNGPRWTQVDPDQPGGQGTVVNVGVTGPPALRW